MAVGLDERTNLGMTGLAVEPVVSASQLEVGRNAAESGYLPTTHRLCSFFPIYGGSFSGLLSLCLDFPTGEEGLTRYFGSLGAIDCPPELVLETPIVVKQEGNSASRRKGGTQHIPVNSFLVFQITILYVDRRERRHAAYRLPDSPAGLYADNAA